MKPSCDDSRWLAIGLPVMGIVAGNCNTFAALFPAVVDIFLRHRGIGLECGQAAGKSLLTAQQRWQLLA